MSNTSFEVTGEFWHVTANLQKQTGRIIFN